MMSKIFELEMNYKTLFYILIIGFTCNIGFAQKSKKHIQYVKIEPDDSKELILKKASNLIPSARQLEWQKMELTAFIHFGINTFTGREWGDGKEDPKLFNPIKLDVKQWVQACKEAGMKLVILTAKHHDGFCLWPSKYTEYSVKNSPWNNGKGDVLKELRSACDEFGLKMGIYVSPWDRHERTYGTDAYNDYFINQLTEVLTNYGVVDEVWFDGANGEGPNGKRQEYDWERYYSTIRKLQPNAAIAIAGPDVRWVGTESGYGRDTEWSIVPVAYQNQDLIAERSQQQEGLFRPKIKPKTEDLGSREKLFQSNELVWYPSEVDVSIRPGWFYHANQDDKVKSVDKLLDIYYSSVGKNSVLLLNLPPDKRGLIHENDVAILKEWRKRLNNTFKNNLAKNAKVIANGSKKDTKTMIDNDYDTFWMDERTSQVNIIELELKNEVTFDRIMLQEQITVGQRVEQFSVEVWVNKQWQPLLKATTIGYKRILRIPVTSTNKVKITINKFRANPAISSIGLYKSKKE